MSRLGLRTIRPLYATGINELTSRKTIPTVVPARSAWTRPSDWVANAAPTGSEVFTGVVAVYDLDGNYIQFDVGTAVVNVTWGDGTTSTGVTGIVSKIYSYASVSSSVTAEGYKTARMVVTLSSGTLTTLSFIVAHASDINTTSTNLGTSYIVELKIEASTLTTLSLRTAGNTTGKHNTQIQNLEIGETSLTSMSSLCNSMRRLQRAVITVPSTCTNVASMFGNCFDLREVSITGTSSVTTCQSMFSTCHNLTSVKMQGFTNASLNTSFLFSTCSSLESADLQGIAPINASNMFEFCRRLRTVPNLTYSSITSAGSMFKDCYSLTTVPALNMSAATTMTSMFQNCYGLQSVGTLTTSSSLTGLGGVFQNCYSLKAGPTITDISGVTNTASMYQDCRTLGYVPDMTFSAASVNATSMFQASNLSVGPAITFNGSGGHTVTSMYASCVRLKSLPAQTWNNVTSMTTTFQSCVSLEAVPPITTPNLSALTQTFQYCNSLKDASNMTLLKNVNLTSMQLAFNECFQLISFPDIDGANVSNFSGTFQGCISLSNVLGSGMLMTGTTQSGSTPNPNYSNLFSNAKSLQSLQNFGFRASADISGSRLSGAALDTVYTSLPSRLATTITNVAILTTNFLTYTTSTAHGYQPGMTVTITGVNPTAFNLTSVRIYDCPTTTTFRINSVTTGTYVSGGTCTPAAMTLTVTNSVGTPSDTPTIATAKGWTVSG